MTFETIAGFIVLGLVVKLIASIDDSIAKVPVISALTSTVKGKVAFAVGNLLAITLSLVVITELAVHFADSQIFRYVAGSLIIVMAAVTYLELLPSEKQRKRGLWPLRREPDIAKFMRLIFAGFTVSLATLVDDMAAMAPLLAHTDGRNRYIIAGIMAATVLHLFLILIFSNLTDRLRYKKEIASVGLALYGALVLTGVL